MSRRSRTVGSWCRAAVVTGASLGCSPTANSTRRSGAPASSTYARPSATCCRVMSPQRSRSFRVVDSWPPVPLRSGGSRRTGRRTPRSPRTASSSCHIPLIRSLRSRPDGSVISGSRLTKFRSDGQVDVSFGVGGTALAVGDAFAPVDIAWDRPRRPRCDRTLERTRHHRASVGRRRPAGCDLRGLVDAWVALGQHVRDHSTSDGIRSGSRPRTSWSSPTATSWLSGRTPDATTWSPGSSRPVRWIRTSGSRASSTSGPHVRSARSAGRATGRCVWSRRPWRTGGGFSVSRIEGEPEARFHDLSPARVLDSVCGGWGVGCGGAAFGEGDGCGWGAGGGCVGGGVERDGDGGVGDDVLTVLPVGFGASVGVEPERGAGSDGAEPGGGEGRCGRTGGDLQQPGIDTCDRRRRRLVRRRVRSRFERRATVAVAGAGVGFACGGWGVGCGGASVR